MEPARILLVEDENIVALDLGAQLRAMGYVVAGQADRADAALRKAIELEPDMILMDIQLKGDVDGIEAAARIQEALDVPVVYVTAYADQATLARAKITNPLGYVLKPFEERELQAAVEMALYKSQTDGELRAYARALERRNRHLALINRLTALSVDDPDVEALVREACAGLVDLIDLPCAMALLFDPLGDGATLITHARGEEGERPPRRVSVGTLRRDLAEADPPLVVTKPAADPRLAEMRATLIERAVHSLALFPLLVHEQLTGGVLACAAPMGALSAQDLQLCRDVVGHLSAALTRVRLWQERQRMSAIIEQADESILVTDTEGSMVYVNPAFERLTGYPLDEVLGRNPRMLKSNGASPEQFEEMWEALAAGETWRGRLENKKKDGSSYVVDATVVPVHDRRGEVENLVSIQRDVTREVRMEEQAHQSSKMEAVGRLAAGVAHDFNNLLTVISGCTQLARDELDLAHPASGLLAEVLIAGDRAAELVAQLLAFSRKQPSQPQVLDVGEVIARLGSMLRRIVDESIDLDIRPGRDLWSVRVDPAQLERVIVNLAANARDAMPLGGELTLQTRNVALGRQGTAFDPDLEPGEYVELSVRDTGCGISAQAMPHIFEPFYTTKEDGRGTGLGLATVYGIVKQSGGAIRVESEPGQGAAFLIYLPRAAGQVEAFAQPALSALPRNGQETILLVEDDAAVRELSHRVLSNLGYALLPASDGREAADLAELHDGQIDLLLTDVIMPGENGKRLADHLTARYPRLKVLFMSGYSGDALGSVGLNDADAPVLAKPFQPVELAHKVRAVLDG